MKCGLFDPSPIVCISSVFLRFHFLCFCICVSSFSLLWCLGYGDHNSKNIFERVENIVKIGYNGGSLWLVRCKSGLRFWEFLVCGILDWMFVDSHYEDVSLAFVLFYIIDR